jgi:N-acetylglucosamine malate deacetylase 2
MFAAVLASADAEAPAGADVLIVVAHPDDETIGIGGHLAELAKTTIVHVTDGAPRDLVDAHEHGFAVWQDYADARRQELTAAMAEAGIDDHQLSCLGFADKEAARNLSQLTLQLAGLIRDRQPRFVCTHPFEGGHPDHDATAFAVASACRLAERAGLQAPAIIEVAFYHLGLDGAVYQDFAPASSAACLERELDQTALDRKRRLLAHFVTQRRTLAAFISTVERFRIAPHYDFLAAANGGRLLYEQLRLGLTGAEWPALAREAARELDLEALSC